MILYINGEKVDLLAGQVIAQTKEVNDIGEPQIRLSNSTNIFKLPKTSNNLRIMQFMSMPGNLSNIPYQKNECSLYSDTGECFIYKGWARITDSGETFEVYIIDGIADFFKIIENKTLSNLDLSDLQHQKTVENIIATWTEDKPYKYILADYNGDTGPVNTEVGVMPEVNIDYLAPSVKVSWLWDKIWETYGAFYHGSVFETFNFQELWMTFPKGQTISGDNDHTIFESDDYSFISPTASSNWSARWNSTDVDELAGNFNQIHMKVAESATYRLRVSGKLFGFRGTDESQHLNAYIRVGLNAEEEPNNTDLYIPEFLEVADNIIYGEDFDVLTGTFALEENDTICLIATKAKSTDPNFSYSGLNNPINELQVELIRIDPNEIDFSDAFKDFNTKDFVREIFQRFALTIYKDKYTPDYRFLTLSEQLLNADTVDWSDKFVRKGTENYIYGTYAQRNWLRYNYNDKESTHNDWYIDVANVNLQDSKDLIKSKIYSPERIDGVYLNETGSKVYKLWDKEIVENPGPDDEPVKYNPLDKRYYFMRSVQRFGTIKVISKQLAGLDETTDMYYRENYYKLPFYDIIQEYYAPIQQILNRAIITDIMLNLSEIDIVNFDFKKLYFFEQLGYYCLMNKIENYIPGRPTKCEVVKVIFSEISSPPQSIKITKVITNGLNVSVYFTMAIGVPWITFQYSTNGVSYSSLVFPSSSNPFGYVLSPGTNYIRIKAGSDFSNVVQFSLPSNTTIIP